MGQWCIGICDMEAYMDIAVIGLVFLNGDYRRTELKVDADAYPEYITYLGDKFKVHTITDNSGVLYKEVEVGGINRTSEEEEELEQGTPYDGDLSLQIDNLMEMVDGQQSIIASLKNQLQESNDIIKAYRVHLNKENDETAKEEREKEDKQK